MILVFKITNYFPNYPNISPKKLIYPHACNKKAALR